MQESLNPLNGTVISSPVELLKILDGLRSRPPFFLQLVGNNGYKLDIGIGRTHGYAQFSPNDGNPPYLMAKAPNGAAPSEDLEFLAGNTPTPIDKRYCLPWKLVVQVAAHFIETGKRSTQISWKEF